jgi:cytochrome c-type biogenesis protein CcsB
MTDATWALLSDQAITAAGAVYFLALLAHLVEWSRLRGSAPADAELAAVGSGETAAAEPPPSEPPTAEGAGQRVAFWGRLGLLLTAIAAVLHLVALVARGVAADPNRVPWGNMYEFTISGTFVLAAMYLLLVRRMRLDWVAPLVLGFQVAVLMVAMVRLHEQVAPLMEALNSPWLVIHVISAIIATGAFTLGGILSAVYLLKLRMGERTTGWLSRVPSLQVLDRQSYRIHAFAFPVWTFAVLITGPIWAKEAWSSYWNWDPKEVWAFITWVVYAAYLHARATAGWKGRSAAILALVGLATLWFNFVVINYFSTTSQHSYAAPAEVPAQIAQE